MLALLTPPAPASMSWRVVAGCVMKPTFWFYLVTSICGCIFVLCIPIRIRVGEQAVYGIPAARQAFVWRGEALDMSLSPKQRRLPPQTVILVTLGEVRVFRPGAVRLVFAVWCLRRVSSHRVFAVWCLRMGCRHAFAAVVFWCKVAGSVCTRS